jgi:Uncharacterised nucleotidyltransferase
LISPELQILLCCAKVDTPENRRSHLLELIPQINDWEMVLELANHHGLIPLMHVRLKETVWEHLPQESRASLELRHRANATHALSMTSELLRLMRLFQENNLFALPYKGPALAAQLFGDVAMRQYGDLDVVIAREDWTIVNTLLCENEWKPEFTLPASQEELYQKIYKDHSYCSIRTKHLLELHWEFAEPRMIFPFTLQSVRTRLLTFTLSDLIIAVPSPEDLLILLCFHGAKHKWERLGWLADITQLLVISPTIDWELIGLRAREARCERVLSLSLRLAHRLFNAPLPELVLQKIRQDSAAITLSEEIESQIFAEKEEAATMKELLLFHLKMRESWLDRILYGVRLIFRTTPEDWAMLPVVLPSSLALFYYPARVFRLFRKYLLRSAV